MKIVCNLRMQTLSFPGAVHDGPVRARAASVPLFPQRAGPDGEATHARGIRGRSLQAAAKEDGQQEPHYQQVGIILNIVKVVRLLSRHCFGDPGNLKYLLPLRK